MTPQAKSRPPKVRSRVEIPVSTTTHWFYQQGEVIQGPEPLSVLLQGLRSRTLSENTVVYHPWSDTMLLGRVVHGIEFYRAQGAPQLTTPPDYDVISVALQAEAAEPAQDGRATAQQVTASGQKAADHGLPPLTGLPKPPPQQQQQQQTAPPMQGPGSQKVAAQTGQAKGQKRKSPGGNPSKTQTGAAQNGGFPRPPDRTQTSAETTGPPVVCPEEGAANAQETHATGQTASASPAPPHNSQWKVQRRSPLQ
ncbi:MAG: hypothetical protein WDW38_002970 [Sanguina aurantia]